MIARVEQTVHEAPILSPAEGFQEALPSPLATWH